MQTLRTTIDAIQPASSSAIDDATSAQSQLAKPPGSLGLLEQVGTRLAGIAGTCPPPVPVNGVVGVFAGDHGVVAQGVTPWPQEITAQMLANMAAGGAAVNVLSRQVGATVMVTDVGVATPTAPHPRVRDRNVRRGTGDMGVEPAMTRDEAVAALEVGIEAAREAILGGADCLMTGEMGIGNTTASSALISVFAGRAPADVTGAGAGADAQMQAHKIDVITRALALHGVDPADPIGVVAAVGGLEQAAIAGFILAAAAARVPVILDGVIACSGACIAVALAPDARDYLLSGHAGVEPGIRAALAHLGLEPLLDLGLRLGEGTGAVLALPMVQSAARVFHEMATFADLGGEARPWRALVLGGARSGKSTWAEGRFADRGVVDYVATSLADEDDQEWEERLALHRARRPEGWRTHETLDVAAILRADDHAPVLVDCLALWLARILDDVGAWEQVEGWRDAVASHVGELAAAVAGTRREVVLVTNEVGLGVVPGTGAGRLFRDELGRLNARLAQVVDEVWMTEAGIPRRLR